MSLLLLDFLAFSVSPATATNDSLTPNLKARTRLHARCFSRDNAIVLALRCYDGIALKIAAIIFIGMSQGSIRLGSASLSAFLYSQACAAEDRLDRAKHFHRHKSAALFQS